MKKEANVLSTRRLMIVGLLGAISMVLGLVPGLGFIPVGPTNATIMHIPVIVGALMEGPLVGGLIGLLFGLLSMFQAITNPTPVSFVFLNPIVSILPRVLIGIITYYSYRLFNNLGNRRSIWILNCIWGIMSLYLAYGIYTNIMDFHSYWDIVINILLLALTMGIAVYTNRKMRDRAIDIIASTALGTLTNTIGVLSAIYFIFAERFVENLGQNVDMARKVIFGIGVANGIPETIIGIIIVTNIVAALTRNK